MLNPQETRSLCEQLCVELGFCLPPADIEAIASNSPQSPSAFMEAVFRAEGLNPDVMGNHLIRQVRQSIVAAFKASGYSQAVSSGSQQAQSAVMARLAQLKAEGVFPAAAIKAIHLEFSVSLGDAKQCLSMSPSWHVQVEANRAFQEEAISVAQQAFKPSASRDA